ncbi:hypothetical protein BH10CYA1_BH10CYA1_46430 [soil metagenome]
MSTNALSESRLETLVNLALSYAEGSADAGVQLVASVDQETIPLLPHELRVTVMDAILSGKKTSLDERGKTLVQAALTATTDESFLVKKSEAYIEAGEQLAAETLLKWRVKLAARNQPASDIHIEALIDLGEVYQSGGKSNDARAMREAAANACEAGAVEKPRVGKLLVKVAQSCYDASDLSQAEDVLKRAVSQFELSGKEVSLDAQRCTDLKDCLRLSHAIAQRMQRSDDALSVARRIQKLLGEKTRVDEIDRLLLTYANLPDHFELTVRPDGVDLISDDFPKIVKEFSGLDLERYFIDAFSQSPGLTAEQRAQVSADLFRVLRTVTKIVTGTAGSTLTRSEETSVDLPRALSDGYVQKVNFGTTVTFTLVPIPPDEVIFVNMTGITFSVGSKLLAVPQLALKAEANICVVKPTLAECGTVAQTASSKLQAITNLGKNIFVGLFLKTTTFSTKLPVVQEEYRRYLDSATNLKRALQYQEKDLLSLFERCARIEVTDPLTRAIFQNGVRICRNVESIQIERKTVSSCDMGGVALKFAPTVNLDMKKTTDELDITDLKGVDMSVAFNAPSELSAIGLDLRRSIPSRIEAIRLDPPKNHARRIVVRTAPGRWIGLDLNEQTMRPAFDQNGNWLIFGITSNPISGGTQTFYLRLDRNNELKMSARELATLVSQTAMAGMNPNDPTTWQWGAVAVGAETMLAAGTILRSTIGDEETEKIVDEVKDVAKFFKDLFF